MVKPSKTGSRRKKPSIELDDLVMIDKAEMGPDQQHQMVSQTIRALASARGSVARRAQKHRRQPLEGPKGPRVAETRESEGPKGPRTSKAQSSFRRLPVLLLLYVFHDSAKNRDIHGTIQVP